MLRFGLLIIVLTCIRLSSSATDEDCVDDTGGLTIAERNYDCSALTDPDHPSNRHIKAYKNRYTLCAEPLQNCCNSCRGIGDENKTPAPVVEDASPHSTLTDTITLGSNTASASDSCKDEIMGFHASDGAYDCSVLKGPTAHVGAYENRRDICDNWQHDCCSTCRELRKHKDYYDLSTPSSDGGIDVNIKVHYGDADDATDKTVVVVLQTDTEHAHQSGNWLSDKLELIGIKRSAADTRGPALIVLAACIFANILYAFISC